MRGIAFRFFGFSLVVLAAIGNMTLAAIPIIYANVHFCAAILTEKQARQRVDFPVPVGAFDGRIFQNPLLGTAGKMSLEDNMNICSKKGWKGLKISLNKKRRQEFCEQLKQLNMGLEKRLADNVEQFSGGQRQALTLLMAVMSKPAILLLDEHTAALDPANAAIVMELTRRFATENNLTVMMITHNMQHALDYGNRLLMMDAGEIIMDIDGEEKQKLTLEDLAERFRQIKKHSITNDQMALQ